MQTVVAAIAGVGLGIVGLVAGALVLIYAGGDVTANYVLDSPPLNAFAIGIIALVLGPLGYFLGRSARMTAASLVGVGATVLGAVSALLWLVITLLGYFGPPPSQ